jgi:hypothetical protein
MNDVSAVVLSVGEPCVARAIESLTRQSLPLAEVVRIDHVSPFFRAINEGARRVRTPFFVQVDADMVLDPGCVQTMRESMTDGIGIVVAELRDALGGQITGIKLFRTECFARGGMSDTISQDTDFVDALARRGWRTEYVEQAGRALPRPTVGEHCPDYTPGYTFRKFVREGAKLRYRGARHGLFAMMGRLEDSVHPMSDLAQLSLAQGFFEGERRDESSPGEDHGEGQRLLDLLHNDRAGGSECLGLLPVRQHPRLRDVFRRFLAAGQSIRRMEAGRTCRALLGGLSPARRDARALVAKMALGRGCHLPDRDAGRLADDEAALRRFMILSLGSQAGMATRFKAHLRHHAGSRRRSRSYVPW